MERSFKTLKQFSLKLIQDLSEDLLGSDTIPWILNNWGQFWLTLNLREVIRIPFAGKWIEFYSRIFKESISMESLKNITVPGYVHDKNCSLPLVILFSDRRVITEYVSFVKANWGYRVNFCLEGVLVENWDHISFSTKPEKYVRWISTDCHMLTADGAQKLEDGSLFVKREDGSWWDPMSMHSGTLIEALMFDMYRYFNTSYVTSSFCYVSPEATKTKPYRVFFGKTQLLVGGKKLIPCIYLGSDGNMIFDAYETFVPTKTDRMFIAVP